MIPHHTAFMERRVQQNQVVLRGSFTNSITVLALSGPVTTGAQVMLHAGNGLARHIAEIHRDIRATSQCRQAQHAIAAGQVQHTRARLQPGHGRAHKRQQLPGADVQLVPGKDSR